MSESVESGPEASGREGTEESGGEVSGEVAIEAAPPPAPKAVAEAAMDITEYQDQLAALGFTLPGEEVKNIFNFVFVAVVGSSLSAEIGGTLFVTNFQVVVVDFSAPEAKLIYAVPMGTIHRLKSKKKAKTLEIFCKDGRDLHMFFPGKLERDSAAQYIHRYAFPDAVHQLFAFIHQAYGGDNISDLVSVEKDYVRQKLHQHKKFRITRINEDFSLCDTYPQTLVTLATSSDEDLRKVAAFRSRNRLPAVVWKHPKKDSYLARCAQPCVGLKRGHSSDDERFLSEMRVPGQATMFVMDSRPKANAVANMMRGGGYELPARYKDASLEFCNIGNIHVMRKSLLQVMRTCQQASPVKSTAEWTAELEASGWFGHMRLVLASAGRVVQLLQRNEAVLVHCSDGWDRTSQTCALAELLLDPFYRTIEGLIVLIEREWLQFGHQFALRYGHGKQMENFKESQRSPIFPQFLDALYQLTVLLPTHFQFNELLLLTLLEELYACRFGTFLCNSVKERLRVQTYTNTASLWSFVMHNRSMFENPNYKKTSKVIVPDLENVKLRLWSGYYLRWKDNNMASLVVMEGSTASAVGKGEAGAKEAAAPALQKHHYATLTAGAMRSPSPNVAQARGRGAVLGGVDAEQLFEASSPASKKRTRKRPSSAVLRGSKEAEAKKETAEGSDGLKKKRKKRAKEDGRDGEGERKEKHRHKRRHRHHHAKDPDDDARRERRREKRKLKAAKEKEEKEEKGEEKEEKTEKEEKVEEKVEKEEKEEEVDVEEEVEEKEEKEEMGEESAKERKETEEEEEIEEEEGENDEEESEGSAEDSAVEEEEEEEEATGEEESEEFHSAEDCA